MWIDRLNRKFEKELKFSQNRNVGDDDFNLTKNYLVSEYTNKTNWVKRVFYSNFFLKFVLCGVQPNEIGNDSNERGIKIPTQL